MAPSLAIENMFKMCSEPFVFVKREQDDYSYEEGGDIDIMARDALQLAKEIIHLSHSMVGNGSSVRMKKYEDHYHVDFLEGDNIIVRIDIIDTLDIKDLLIKNSVEAQLAFRLLEYARFPHKKKHLEYVKKYFKEL